MKTPSIHLVRPTVLLAVLLMSVSLPDAAAQEKGVFTADLNLLTRGEIRDGGVSSDPAVTSNGDYANFALERTRVVLGYKKNMLTVRASLQHSAVWGQAGRGTVGVFEAWTRIAAPWGLFVQLGRQALRYDDERIIGPNDWTMTGNAHDALRLGFDGKVHRLHVIAAFNQNAENTVSGSTYYTGGAFPYKTMQTAWYHCDLPWTPLGLSLLAMNIGMQGGKQDVDEHIEWQQLVGGYAQWTLPGEALSLEASYYKQMGKNEYGQKIDAWMAAVKATSRFSVLNTPFSLYSGYDCLSGDKYFALRPSGSFGLVRHDVIRGFNPLYGSHHKFYGAMDFFYVSTYFDGFTPGLQNAYVGLNASPLKGLEFDVAYHFMSTAVKLKGMAMTLGHELELSASYRLMEDVTLTMGYSFMTGTDTMEQLKRASSDGRLRWGWISLSATPRL